MAARIRLFVKTWPLWLSAGLLILALAVSLHMAYTDAKFDRILKEIERVGNPGLPRGDSERLPVNPPAKE